LRKARVRYNVSTLRLEDDGNIKANKRKIGVVGHPPRSV
jgi:hypothetical protein